MDGCTCVAGSRPPTNDIKVHHVNMTVRTQQNPDRSVAGRQQRRIRGNVAKRPVTNSELIDPADYYDPTTRGFPMTPCLGNGRRCASSVARAASGANGSACWALSGIGLRDSGAALQERGDACGP